jgi:subtilisin family serine protease
MRALLTLLLLVPLSWSMVACGGDDPVVPKDPVEPIDPIDPIDPFDPADPLPASLGLFLEEADVETREEVLSDYGFELVAVLGDGRLVFVRGDFDPVQLADDERILAFQSNTETEISSPVELTMSFYEGDFDEDLPAQDAFARWDLDQVHAIGRGAGMRIAVLDTGVDPTHPLLRDRVRLLREGEWHLGSLEVASGVDTDGNGVFDEAYGHGTHVAGIIASIAPEAEILCIRVLDSDGVGTAFDLVAGLYYAMAWGADLVNLSLILSDESEVVEFVLSELADRKIMVVGAAGNVPGEPFFPATYGGVISVAALDADFELAPFSAYEDVRLGAPGVAVLSAFPGARWASATGTSMASASASGALALVAGIVGDAEDARGILSNTATPMDLVNDGAIDLLAAARDAAMRAANR